jgi:DNA polymerase
MAGEIYGMAENEWRTLPSDSAQRFVGKVAMLGLGYGMSGDKFNDTLALGSMGPAVFLPRSATQHIVYNVYRPNHPNIVQTWRELDDVLTQMTYKDCNFEWKCLQIKHNQIILPNGMAQVYHDLRLDDERSKSYEADNHRHNIYGGLFDENIVQALARIPIGDAMCTIRRRYPIVMHSHDELAALVPEREADEALAFMIDEVSRPPSWAPNIPLKAEGGYDYCYSK